MKKILLFVLLSTFLMSCAGQQITNFEKRAKRSSNAIANDMDLNKEKKEFIYTCLVERQNNNYAQIKGKDLTEEEKSVIFTKSNKTMTTKLLTKFTVEEVKIINGMIQKQQKKRRES